MYLDEVKAANTVDALIQAKARWVQTPSLSLAVIVSSLLGEELPTDPTFLLSRRSSPVNAQRPTGDTTRVSYARVLFTLIVGCRTFLFASLIVGAMLLNLLVSGMLMMPAFQNPYGAVTGRVCLPGCLRVRSRLRGDRDIEGSHTPSGSDHFAAGNTDAIGMFYTTFIETFFLASVKPTTCTAHPHHKRLNLASPPKPGLFYDGTLGATPQQQPCQFCWC